MVGRATPILMSILAVLVQLLVLLVRVEMVEVEVVVKLMVREDLLD